MSSEPNRSLVSLLEELDRLPGVRGSLVATVDGAYQASERGAFDNATATDIAKTVRRMVVASATVGSAIEELLITFGSARMMIVPVREEATLTIMLERDSATPLVRSTLQNRIGGLLQQLGSGSGSGESSVSNNVVAEPEDEVDRLMSGELGPVLRDVQAVFTTYVVRGGRDSEEAGVMMREQMREWLLCCNPSPYTFPLLIDGLSQVLSDRQGERTTFMNDVQAAMRNSKLWAGKR
ncbi:MAG TPA: roadblock/LC7 domain-containing protein [Nannocystis sp.]|jgi:predicted regulator of Ras-like GTPase activity (Roadblock/LC7/MglB family)